MATLLRRVLPRIANIRNTFRALPVRGVSMDDDGDVNPGTTTVEILNKEQDEGIFFEAYSQIGFLLSSGIRVMGPCAVFPKSILHWNVSGAKDIDEDSLSLFTILEPKIDLLLLGVGERENLTKVNSNLILYLRSKRINVEILTTDQALSTFNFLNSEKRYVAAALIPPSYVDEDDDDVFRSASIGSDDYVMRSDMFDVPDVDEEELKQIYEGPRKAMERLGRILPGPFESPKKDDKDGQY